LRHSATVFGQQRPCCCLSPLHDQSSPHARGMGGRSRHRRSQRGGRCTFFVAAAVSRGGVISKASYAALRHSTHCFHRARGGWVAAILLSPLASDRFFSVAPSRPFFAAPTAAPPRRLSGALGEVKISGSCLPAVKRQCGCVSAAGTWLPRPGANPARVPLPPALCCGTPCRCRACCDGAPAGAHFSFLACLPSRLSAA
jgi:hypothetical protein